MEFLTAIEGRLCADSSDDLQRRRALLREILEAFEHEDEGGVTRLLVQRASAFEREGAALVKALRRYLQGDVR
jgi:hypothetical protein